MRSKLVVLGALIIGCAAVEYTMLGPSFGAAPAALSTRAENQVLRSLPAAIGSFNKSRHWRSRIDLGAFEVGASYRDGQVEAALDFLLGAEGPHNGVVCSLIQGYSLLDQRLRGIRTAGGSVVFDVALLRDDKGLALVASSECYPSGCSERMVADGPGVGLFFYSSPRGAVVPVSIVVRELRARPAESTAAEELWLRQGLTRFAGGLDLGALLGPSFNLARPAPYVPGAKWLFRLTKQGRHDASATALGDRQRELRPTKPDRPFDRAQGRSASASPNGQAPQGGTEQIPKQGAA